MMLGRAPVREGRPQRSAAEGETSPSCIPEKITLIRKISVDFCLGCATMVIII